MYVRYYLKTLHKYICSLAPCRYYFSDEREKKSINLLANKQIQSQDIQGHKEREISPLNIHSWPVFVGAMQPDGQAVHSCNAQIRKY